ncbi:hypothetical protein ACGF4C_35075 [Streptomyces sp. NPDC048197]|uniref:hypothetical protein n=1 Tax=Streptomyces sp. NPDC048197 TaxID=3365511 RepID=UPI00371F9939
MGEDAVTTLALRGVDNTGKTKRLGGLARRLGSAAGASGPLDADEVLTAPPPTSSNSRPQPPGSRDCA